MEDNKIKQDKTQLRRRISLLRKEFLRSAGASSVCACIWEQVEEMPEFKIAETVFVYSSLPDEVPTQSFIARWYGIKRIVLPLVKGDTLQLREFAPHAVCDGYRGIIEPDEDCPLLDPSEIDFAIIPGVAFTVSGMRLGRGGGYYDKILGKLQCRKVGVALPCQIVDEIPSDPWDKPLDKIIW